MRSKTKEYRSAYQREWLAADPARLRGRNLIKYWPECSMQGAGLRYQELFALQDGKCKICDNQIAAHLDVDHCHNTNVVRGLLCNPCNRGLGFFRDNPIALRKAADYIEQSREFTLTGSMQSVLAKVISLMNTSDSISEAIAIATHEAEWQSRSEKDQFVAWANSKLS